jgi:hypothetical protein
MLVNTNQTLISNKGCDVAQWLVSNIDMETKSSSDNNSITCSAALQYKGHMYPNLTGC